MAQSKARACRLPYALCKKYGIEVQPDWKPRDAWEALEKHTGKSMFQMYTEMPQDKLKSMATQIVYPKDERHPTEVSHAVNDRISTYYKRLQKTESVIFDVCVGDYEYRIELLNAEANYDYKILKREKIK